MRLGLYPARLVKGTVASEAYNAQVENGKSRVENVHAKTMIKKRHRHRYEVNPKYIKHSRKRSGISGRSPDGKLYGNSGITREGAEHTHPFFLGTQFHPEFLARPLTPHPLFTAFIEAAKEMRVAKLQI